MFQTGSQQRSNVFGPFREAVEIIRSGRLGKIKRVSVGVGGPSRWCDLPEDSMEPGLNWDLWLGCAPLRPYHSALSPRGAHNHFPAWRAYREYAGGCVFEGEHGKLRIAVVQQIPRMVSGRTICATSSRARRPRRLPISARLSAQLPCTVVAP